MWGLREGERGGRHETCDDGSANPSGHRTRKFILAEAPSTGSTEIEAEIVPLVQKIEAGSIAEIEKMMGEMQEAKNFLQTEWGRIQRETARYMKLAQTASASVEIIFETVRGWREAGHPVDNESNPNAFNT
jgi:hypothetical protein